MSVLQAADEESLVTDLRALGVVAGDSVLVHASYSSLGPLNGAAQTVITALERVLGEHGTLCMPSLSYAHIDWNDPVFNVHSSKGCVGYLSEYFRQQDAVLRSMHLSHSVLARGKNAAVITGSHHLDNTPCGPHSPFVKLRDCGGKILMIGCGLGPNTFMHAVEESLALPYLFVDGIFRYTCINAAGERLENMRSKRHALFEQYYERVAAHLAEPALRCGMLAQAQAHLLDCRVLWDTARACLQKNPLYFTQA